MGFAKQPDLLGLMGVDQVVSDAPLSLPGEFQTLQDKYPYVYRLKKVASKFFLGHAPGKVFFIDSWDSPKFKSSRWGETSLSFSEIENKSTGVGPDLLFLQKTFLPGWKAMLNGKPKEIKPGDDALGLEALMTLQLDIGRNEVVLTFEPAGLRLGFFLFFLMSGVLAFFLLRSRAPSIAGES
jgi:hypothetical protein